MLSRDDGPDRSADVVTAAQRLSSLVVASREEGERIRRVPSHVVEALAAAGSRRDHVVNMTGVAA